MPWPCAVKVIPEPPKARYVETGARNPYIPPYSSRCCGDARPPPLGFFRPNPMQFGRPLPAVRHVLRDVDWPHDPCPPGTREREGCCSEGPWRFDRPEFHRDSSQCDCYLRGDTWFDEPCATKEARG